jgi:hypothetical protein
MKRNLLILFTVKRRDIDGFQVMMPDFKNQKKLDINA